MSVVSILKTDNYEQESLNEIIRKHFDNLSVRDDLRPDMKIVIKPNLISAHKPDHAATTNPNILIAIVNVLHEYGCTNITIADSPGGVYASPILKNIYSVCGFKPLEEIATLNYDTGWKEIKAPEGSCVHSFNIINPIVEADYIINAAKLKTHTMTTLSAGIKNLFGCIPGLQKPEMHYRFPEIDKFSNMLIDLSKTVAPNITILDAVDGMEGNGPNAGTPKHLGLTFASRDMYTQDWIAADLIGIEPETVSMLRIAKEKGYANPEHAEITGITESIAKTPFLIPESVAFDFMARFPRFMQKPLNKICGEILKPMPTLTKSKCVGCGKCAESCPPQIIKIKNKKAKFVKKGCISCFCCQEMCPAKAIEIKRKIRL